MKRIFLTLFLIINIALVLFLFRNGLKPREQVSIVNEQLVIHQSSRKAIINLHDATEIAAFNQRGVKVITREKEPTTLIRIHGHHGPSTSLNHDSPGEVFVINPDGIIVGNASDLSNISSSSITKLKASSSSSSELKAYGNVYALAINEEGAVRAVAQNGKTQKPTVFEFPDLEDAPVISDE